MLILFHPCLRHHNPCIREYLPQETLQNGLRAKIDMNRNLDVDYDLVIASNTSASTPVTSTQDRRWFTHRLVPSSLSDGLPMFRKLELWQKKYIYLIRWRQRSWWYYKAMKQALINCHWQGNWECWPDEEMDGWHWERGWPRSNDGIDVVLLVLKSKSRW